MTTEITAETTWFKVTKYSGMNTRSSSPYNVYIRTPDRLHGQARFADGFDTRAEAVAAGLAKGWIQVEAWYEAEQQAKPITDERERRGKLYRKAIEGKAHIAVTFPAGTTEKFYLDSEIAQRFLESLGEPDEHGVINNINEGENA